MYFHLRQKTPAPLELVRWNLAEKFGWTLDYIDSLPLSDLEEYLQIQDGRAKAGVR